MAETTGISWAHATFNPWIGCTKVSQGCKHCYAKRDMDDRYGKARWGPQGTRMVTSDANWRLPLRWNREAEASGGRKRVFCSSLADVFEDWPGLMTTLASGDFRGATFRALPDGSLWLPGLRDREDARDATMQDFRDALFRLIEDTPALDWMLLTKRPENVLGMVPEPWRGGLPPNVWVGTSVEDQRAADARIPHLLEIPAAVRFLSCEPLLGPVDLRHIQTDVVEIDALTGDHGLIRPLQGRSDARINWVIGGGESGPNARPCHPAWARLLRDQCAETWTAFHWKQWGAHGHGAETFGKPSFREFRSFGQWIDKASGWVNGGVCVDAKGRVLLRGADFERARDEDAFPVAVMHRMDVKRAGRLLNGVTHDAFPEAAMRDFGASTRLGPSGLAASAPRGEGVAAASVGEQHEEPADTKIIGQGARDL